MKLNKIASALVLTLGMVAGASADQGHGTVTFTGSIIDAPCSIHPDSVDQEVALGQIASAQLMNGGKSTPRFFDIKLENCSLAADGDNTVSMIFGGAEANDAKDLLAVSGEAKGAGVAITDMTGKQITLGEETSTQGLVEGNNILQLSAYLQGLDAGAIEAGEFQAVSTFAMVYQ